MRLKIVIYLWILSVSLVLGNNEFKIQYKAPLIPLEITVDENGFDFSLTREIMTPLGSFGLGYSAYKAEFEEDYTYVIIEDMNSRKEHIYKVKDKSTLRLVNKGTTGVEIKKNRVRIMIEKGSEFKLEFEVIGNDSSSYRSSRIQWLDVSASICRANGGTMLNRVCKVPWSDAKKICRVSGGVLPSFDELKAVVKGCGGINVGFLANNRNAITDKNIANKSYQKCYKSKGFSSNYYWSSTTYNVYFAWIVRFFDGSVNNSSKYNSSYVRCVRAGE